MEILIKGFLVAQRVKNLPSMRKAWVQSLGQEDPLEQGMATQSSILAWKIPWTEESGWLWSTGSQKVGHDWTQTHIIANIEKPCTSWKGNRGGAFWNMKSKLDLAINHIQQRKTEVEMMLRFWGNHNGNKNHSLYLNLRKNSFFTHQVLLC